MSKFQIGDKVTIPYSRRSVLSGLVGFIESIDTDNADSPLYNIMDINKNRIACDVSEDMLELKY